MKLLKDLGFTNMDKKIIKDKVRKILNRNPNIGTEEAQIKALTQYRKEIQMEHDSIISQVEAANAGK